MTIQQGFVDELGTYLQPVADLEKMPDKKQSKKLAALGLIEQNEMDEMVALTTISSKAAMDNSESINLLIKRLNELAEYNDHIFHGKALEPKRLCDAMQEAVSQTDLIDSNKLIFYRFFDEALMKDLGKLYDELNNLLIEQGILPEMEIDYSGVIPHYEAPEYEEVAEDIPPPASQLPQPNRGLPPGTRRAFGSGMSGYSGYSSASPPPSPMQGGAPMPPPMRAGGGYAPPAGGGYAPPAGGEHAPPAGGEYAPPAGGGYAPPASGGYAPPAGGEYAPPASGGYAPPAGGGYAPPAGGEYAPPAGVGRRAFGSGMQSFSQGQPVPAPGSGVAGVESAGPSGQAYSAGVPVGRVRQSIENFVGGSHADIVTGGNENYYSHQQVMTALTDLQTPAGELSQTPLVFDANLIKKAILSSIGESEGGAVTKAVNRVSEKTIDFIKLIFDVIIDEKNVTDEIKTLLLSLQIPVIKAAMLDSDFFVDDLHPARQLLDKIAEAGVGVSEHKDPVYIEIEKIVRNLLNYYEEDVVAFTVALEELKDLTEEIYRKARETEAESKKSLKMTHARQTVLQEIRKITLGKELPQSIRTLVLKIWPSMMFNHYLRNGKANDEWLEMLMILRKIIESVQPLHSMAELAELGDTHVEIVTAARSKLEQFSKKQEILDQVVSDLEATYEKLMKTEGLPPDGTEPQLDSDLVDQVAQAEPEPEPEPDQEISPKEIAKDKISKLPEGVSPGSWCIVYNGEDQPVMRLKLAVILVQDATMVFVDHLGNVIIEKDAEIFADEVEKGLSGIIMQRSVFDYALNSALETIAL